MTGYLVRGLSAAVILRGFVGSLGVFLAVDVKATDCLQLREDKAGLKTDYVTRKAGEPFVRWILAAAHAQVSVRIIGAITTSL